MVIIIFLIKQLYLFHIMIMIIIITIIIIIIIIIIILILSKMSILNKLYKHRHRGAESLKRESVL